MVDFLPSWSHHLPLLTSWSVFCAIQSRILLFSVQLLLNRGPVIFLVDVDVVFRVHVLFLFPYDALFTDLLRYKYLIAFTSQPLVLFLVEIAILVLKGLLPGLFSFLFARVFLPFFFLGLVLSNLLDFGLSNMMPTFTCRSVSSILCLYFLSSRMWYCSMVSYSLASFMPGAE